MGYSLGKEEIYIVDIGYIVYIHFRLGNFSGWCDFCNSELNPLFVSCFHEIKVVLSEKYKNNGK